MVKTRPSDRNILCKSETLHEEDHFISDNKKKEALSQYGVLKILHMTMGTQKKLVYILIHYFHDGKIANIIISNVLWFETSYFVC